MKILHVYKTYYPDTFGGVEKFIQTLSKGMIENSIESAVFCLTPNREFSEIIVDGIKVYKIPHLFSIASTPFSFKAFFKFRKIIKDFDCIHYHFPYPFQDILFLFFGRSKKSLVTYHSDIVKQKGLYFFYKQLEYFFLKNINKIVATSPNYFKTSHILKQHKDKVTVIPLGIDIIKKTSHQALEVQKIKHKYGSKFFLFLGVLRYYKGLHTLLDAVKETGFSVVIAGDGPLKNALIKEAKTFENIHFIGSVTEEQKINLLSSCYAFIFPSHLRSEAFGLSLLEAAMYKKPMITCEIGTGTSYINLHNKTGIIIPPNDKKALSDAMKNLFENDDIAKKFGENAYQRYLDLFTVDKMIDRYKDVYSDLMNLKKI